VEFPAIADVACTARFANDIERLTVQIARDLPGTVGRVYTTGTATPRALDCTSSCERPFTRNTIVELRPDTSVGEIASWVGCDSTYVDTNAVRNPVICRVFMDRPRHVAAFFVPFNLFGDTINHVAASFLPGSNGGEVRIRPRLGLRTALPCTPDGGSCEVPFAPQDTAVIDVLQYPGRPLTYHEGCDTLTPPTSTDYAQCRVSMSRNRVVRFSFGGANVAPTARITRTPAGDVAVNESVLFSAADSTDDQDVAQLSYSWDFDADGIFEATGVTTTYAFSSAGVYDVTLRVTDAARASSTAVATVAVNAGANAPPVASFVYAPTTPQVGTTVSFDASGSSDDGRITRYEWDLNGDGTYEVSGTPNDARTVSFIYAAAGTYTVRLRVTDDLNATAETTRSLTITSAANNSDLTLTIVGGGAGVVTYTPGAVACSNETGANQIVCVRQFPTGTQVVLRAFAYSGSRIGEWSGCTSVNSTGEE
jgi:PKD repeat protein